MSVIKPPSFDKLVKRYGEVGALKFVLSSGLTPKEVSYKYGVPYHRVLLVSRGLNGFEGMKYSDLTLAYDRIALARGKKAKEAYIVRLISRGEIPVEPLVRLLTGKIWDVKIGLGEGFIRDCLSVVYKVSPERLSNLYNSIGDYGEVAEDLTKNGGGELYVKEVYLSLKLFQKLDVKERGGIARSMLSLCSGREAKYLVRLMLGDLKLGFKEATLIKAFSKAYDVDLDLLKDTVAIRGLIDALKLASTGLLPIYGLRIKPGVPLRPMLAHIYSEEKISFPSRVEFKYDGSRIQIHRDKGRVWLFTRRMKEKSEVLPEIVSVASNIKSESFILDSEVIPLSPDGKPLPFQYLLERTLPKKYSGRKVNVGVKIFDIIYLNGEILINRPLSERLDILQRIVPEEYLAEGVICENGEEIKDFFDRAVKEGYEGVMIKDLNSKYEPGRRIYTWLKLKPRGDTVDCVVVKAYYGRGRRAGYYSSLLLAVRDPKLKKLYTVGRVSNISEEIMAELKEDIERYTVRKDKDGVWVQPKIVVEVSALEIQKSPEYSSGFALRVPRIVRFRLDKSVDEVDTVEKIKELYERKAPRL